MTILPSILVLACFALSNVRAMPTGHDDNLVSETLSVCSQEVKEMWRDVKETWRDVKETCERDVWKRQERDIFKSFVKNYWIIFKCGKAYHCNHLLFVNRSSHCTQQEHAMILRKCILPFSDELPFSIKFDPKKRNSSQKGRMLFSLCRCMLSPCAMVQLTSPLTWVDRAISHSKSKLWCWENASFPFETRFRFQ